MKKLLYPALIVSAVFSSAFTFIANTSWQLKDDAYSVKIISDKFEGAFKGLKTEIVFDESNLSASKISASIDAKSINTGNGMRNKHANQGLESAKFPTVTFESSSIVKKADAFEASGKLTIKGVTKEIKLPFSFSKTADGGLFSGKFQVLPKDYQITKGGTPERFDVELSVPVVK